MIFELIERFAGYGFNKSHSTRYSFIAYQTAYMKAYWPLEYMAALLTFEMGNTDKVVDYIAECKDMGINVLPPDINESFADFTVVYENAGHDKKGDGLIRFGLAAVKGVGTRAVEQMIAAREKAGRFKSLFHFCENVDLRAVNKQVVESLIKAGGFDRLGGHRAQMTVAVEKAMQGGQSSQADKLKGQMNFFSGLAASQEQEKDHEQLPNVPPWPELMMLTYEKDVLGFYVTSNPIEQTRRGDRGLFNRQYGRSRRKGKSGSHSRRNGHQDATHRHKERPKRRLKNGCLYAPGFTGQCRGGAIL